MTCPVALCGGHAHAGHLMCRDCWSRVPLSLQRQVNGTWRKFRSLGAASGTDAKLDARKSYLNATQAAVDAAEASRP